MGKLPIYAWARKIVPDEAREGKGLSRKERVLLEEIARLGYLIEHGFGIQLSADRATDAGVDSPREGIEERRRPAGRNDV